MSMNEYQQIWQSRWFSGISCFVVNFYAATTFICLTVTRLITESVKRCEKDKYRRYLFWEKIWSLWASCEYRLKSGLGQRGQAGWGSEVDAVKIRMLPIQQFSHCTLDSTVHTEAFLHCAVHHNFLPCYRFDCAAVFPQEISPPNQGFPAKHRFHKFSPECSYIGCLCFQRKSFTLVTCNQSS